MSLFCFWLDCSSMAQTMKWIDAISNPLAIITKTANKAPKHHEDLAARFTGLEYVSVYLAIIDFTFIFSFFASKCIFHELDMCEINYPPKLKKRSLWLILSSVLSIVIWSRIFLRLLSLLQ